MESYEKLKKRTFKLTYISEAEKPQKVKPDNGKSSQEDVDAASQKDAEAKAQEVIAAGAVQKHDPSKQVKGGEPYAYLGVKTNKINLVGGPVGAGWPKPIADAGGNPDVSSEAWTMLVNWFKDGGAEELSREQIEAEEEAE